jgi:peptidoglycan/LPS O-acetylase OafA/YrhL
VIAASAARSGSTLAGDCLARIIRLSLPCAAALALAGGVAIAKWNGTPAAAAIVDHWWIKSYAGDPDIRDLPAEALGAYYLRGSSLFDPPLWTMRRELLGSIGVYCAFAIARRRGSRLWLAALLTAVLFAFRIEPATYVCFVAGAVLYLTDDATRRLPSWMGAASLVLGLFLGGRPLLPPAPGSPYAFLADASLGRHILAYCWPAGATFVVLAILLSARAAKILSGPVPGFFGRISFGVYLVHFVLLKSLFAHLFVGFGHFGPGRFALCVLAYAACVVVCGYLFTVGVDRPAIRLSRRVRRAFWVGAAGSQRLGARPEGGQSGRTTAG